MPSINKLPLYRKLVILALLSVGLAIAVSNPPPPALAAQCCQECLQTFARCENSCAVQCEGIGGSCYIDCWDECYSGYQAFTYCGGRCTWCSQGGGGGNDSPFGCSFSGPTLNVNEGRFENGISCSDYSATCYQMVQPFVTYNWCCDNYGCY